MKLLLFIYLFIGIIDCTSCSSQPQTKHDKTTIQQSDVKEAIGYINNFFDKYKNEGTKKAIDYIFSTNNAVVGLDNLKNKLDSIRMALGDFTGAEQITEKNVANGLVLFSYLVKHKNHPIRFTFIFYKPENNWCLYKFYFDTDIIDELQYSGKIYFIK